MLKKTIHVRMSSRKSVEIATTNSAFVDWNVNAGEFTLVALTAIGHTTTLERSFSFPLFTFFQSSLCYANSWHPLSGWSRFKNKLRVRSDKDQMSANLVHAMYVHKFLFRSQTYQIEPTERLVPRNSFHSRLKIYGRRIDKLKSTTSLSQILLDVTYIPASLIYSPPYKWCMV